jgi:hypothetical protein
MVRSGPSVRQRPQYATLLASTFLACVAGILNLSTSLVEVAAGNTNRKSESGECDKLLVSGSFRQTVSEIFLKVDANLGCFCGDSKSSATSPVLNDLGLVVQGCDADIKVNNEDASSLFLTFHEDIVAAKSTVQVVESSKGTRVRDVK